MGRVLGAPGEYEKWPPVTDILHLPKQNTYRIFIYFPPILNSFEPEINIFYVK